MRRAIHSLLALLPLVVVSPAASAAGEEAPMHRDHVSAATASADGARILTSSTSGEAVLWQTAPFQPILELAPGESGEDRGRISAIAIDSTGARALIAQDWAATVELWTLGAAPSFTRLAAHSARTTAAAFAPKGALLATAGADRGPAAAGAPDDDQIPPMLPAVIRLWRGERLSTELPAPPGRVTALAFDATGERLAAGGDGQVRVWEVATGRLDSTLKAPGQVAAIAFDGGSVCVVASDGTACHGGGKATALPARSPALAAAVTHSLIVASTHEEVEVWSRAKGARIAALPGRAAAVVPVGADLWVVFEDRAVLLHDGRPTGVEHRLMAVSP